MIARVVAEQVVESVLGFEPVDFEPAAPGPFVEAD